MRNWYKKIEFASNIAIIVVALLLGGIFVIRYWSPYSANTQPLEVENVKGGTKLLLPNVDWNKNSKSVVLAISPACRYCTDSLPFYRKLAAQKNDRDGFSVIVIAPQSVSETQEYLNKNGIKADDVRQTALSAINVRATPTLIVLDNQGTVVNSWVGKLSLTKEAEVVESLHQ